MPMVFTDKMVAERAAELGVENTREAVATETELRFRDFVEAWEIRTGRPWSTMTSSEAMALIAQHPECGNNPGVLSRLRDREGVSLRNPRCRLCTRPRN